STAATLVPLAREQHDRLMSYVLGLSHLLNIVFATALADSGLSYDELKRVGSTTFLSQMRTTAPVARENTELYYAIQRLNAFTPDVHAALSHALETVTDAVRRGDRERFVALMSACHRWVGDDGM